MTETFSNSSVVSQTGNSTPRSAKPVEFRPHYFTTFQNYCCGPKSKPSSSSKTTTTTATTTTTTTTPTTNQTKDILPIPEKIKKEVENLVNGINEVLIEDLMKIKKYTNLIPNKFLESDNYYDIQRYLIDRAMFKTIKDAGVINWVPSFTKLYPIRTSGNGNCLLNAVLIAMIGIHDLNLYLRDRLVQFMQEYEQILKNQWRIERLKSDKLNGIISEDSQLDRDWKEACDFARYENSEDGQVATHLEYLEAVHIFSIANMLYRPIIVISEEIIRNKNGEPIGPNDLYGIYLPTFSPPKECHTEPIVIAYDQSHFCPLMTSDYRDVGKTAENCIPLHLSVNHAYDKTTLPIRFLGEDTTVEQSENLLRDYLRVKTKDYIFDAKSLPLPILCAELGSKHMSTADNIFLLFEKYLNDFFEVQKPRAIEEERGRERQRELDNYYVSGGYYDTRDRTLTRDYLNGSSTGSSRSAYGNTISANFQTRDKNSSFYEPQYSSNDVYHDGTYVPYKSQLYIENNGNQSQRSPRLSQYGQGTERDRDYYNTNTTSLKSSYLNGTSDNINNLNNDNKKFNTNSLSPRTNDFQSRSEQQTNVVPIPVQYASPRATSSNQSSFGTDTRVLMDECIACNRPFYVSSSSRTYICPSCDSQSSRFVSRKDVLVQPTSENGRTNLYLPGIQSRTGSAMSPVLKSRIRYYVECPYCRITNINSLSQVSDYTCSSCRRIIPSSFLYY